MTSLDARIAARAPAIWIGAEPTFTLRESNEPCWLWQAEGGEKRARAEAVAASLARRLGGAVEEVPGRHYPDEEAPRFCLAVRWPTGKLTVTPDPGVVEINTAPCPDGARFLEHLRAVYGAAEDAGLSPVRYRFNGDATDSGGGGQLTLGGPSPDESPFFGVPHLLPRMVAYFNDHPSLSYGFVGEHAGSASQSPRPDEGVRERWEELRLACRVLLGTSPERITPELLWSSLAPLLVDASGNSHRCELNIEKLWNPGLEGRGRMGVVELRAFKMQPDPERLALAGQLVRAVAARCAVAPVSARFHDWGGDLHDRASLPTFLAADLEEVLRDLDAHGLGFADDDAARLLEAGPPLWAGAVGGAQVQLRRALDFWPLIGDVASQERATSRLVDASTERLELRIGGADHVIEVAGVPVTPRPAGGDPSSAPMVVGAALPRGVDVIGLRRRVYAPSPGLHPTVAPLEPLSIRIVAGDQELTLQVFGWRPGGGPYDGLPLDADEAARRRAERIVVLGPTAAGAPPPRIAAGETWTFDLRALARPEIM